MLSKRFKHAHFEVACRLNSPTAKAAARTPPCFDSKHPRTVFRSDCVFERLRLPTSRLLLPRLNRTPIRVGGVGSERVNVTYRLSVAITQLLERNNAISRELRENCYNVDWVFKCNVKNTGHCLSSLFSSKLIYSRERDILNEIDLLKREVMQFRKWR